MEDRKERAIHSYEVDERDIESSVRKIVFLCYNTGKLPVFSCMYG
jgi:hypothetical protein